MPTNAEGDIPASAPIAVLFGPERFLILDATDALKRALVNKHGEVAQTLYDGASVKPADVLDECRSMSLMMHHKLVIIDRADAMLSEADSDDAAPAAARKRGQSDRPARELFEAYAASPDPSATLLLRADTWRSPRLDSAITRSGGVVRKFDWLDDASAVAWAKNRARQHHGHAIDPDAVNALIATVGSDLARIDSELAKLALSVDSRPGRAGAAITAADVREMCGQTREEDIWAIQAGLFSGDRARMLANLHEALDVSRHSPVAVHIAYLSLARQLDAAARGFAARDNPNAIASRAKLWGATRDAVLNRGRSLKPAQTAGLLAAAIDTDRRLKSSGGDPVHLLEAMTLRFASVLGG